MTHQLQESRLSPQERLERAHRILDAAAALVLRWGYNKTTIDDIAREARVGKGTIYLHWRTREALFQTLLRREQLSLAEDFQQRVAADPEGARLGNLIKHTTLAMMQRPLLKAVVLRDTAVLGKLVEQEQGSTAFGVKLQGFQHYLAFLRERNLVRSDLDDRAQIHILAAVTMGFFVVQPTLPAELACSDEELGERIALTVRGALEPARPISAEELAEASRAFLDYTSRVVSALQTQLQQELGA